MSSDGSENCRPRASPASASARRDDRRPLLTAPLLADDARDEARRPRRATVRTSTRSSSSIVEADRALAQFGLDRFDEVDEREVVGVEVLAQPGVERDGVGVDLEDLGELLAHEPLDLGRGRAGRGGCASRPASATPEPPAASRVGEPRDDSGDDRVARDAHRVDDRGRRRRAVRDHAHAVHAEQHRAAGVVGQQRRRRLEQAQLQRVGDRCPLGLVDDGEHEAGEPEHRAFERSSTRRCR